MYTEQASQPAKHTRIQIRRIRHKKRKRKEEKEEEEEERKKLRNEQTLTKRRLTCAMYV